MRLNTSFRAAGPLAGHGPIRQQLNPIDEHPDRRDCGPAHLCDHLAPRRRQDHHDREIAIVWRAIELAGEVKARGGRKPPGKAAWRRMAG